MYESEEKFDEESEFEIWRLRRACGQLVEPGSPVLWWLRDRARGGRSTLQCQLSNEQQLAGAGFLFFFQQIESHNLLLFA